MVVPIVAVPMISGAAIRRQPPTATATTPTPRASGTLHPTARVSWASTSHSASSAEAGARRRPSC